jgi:hypothetical protein
MPLIKSYGEHLQPVPLWIFRIVSAAIILNVGVLIGLTFLALLGVMPWSLLGTIFMGSVVPTTVIGVLCSVGFTMYETLQYKAQYETTRARLSSLESRIRPHFLFNTLNSIMALIPEDPDAAEHMTERLATLLRYSLDATLQNTVRSKKNSKSRRTTSRSRRHDRSAACSIPSMYLGINVDAGSSVQPADSCGEQREVWRRRNPHPRAQRQWASAASGVGFRQGFPLDKQLPEGHGLQI